MALRQTAARLRHSLRVATGQRAPRRPYDRIGLRPFFLGLRHVLERIRLRHDAAVGRGVEDVQRLEEPLVRHICGPRMVLIRPPAIRAHVSRDAYGPYASLSG